MSVHCFFFVLIMFVLSNISYGQTPIKVQENNGTIIAKQQNNNRTIIIYRKITKYNEDKVLLVNKYIDTTKQIILDAGGIQTEGNMQTLTKKVPVMFSGKMPIYLVVKKGRLLLNCLFYSIEGNVAAKLEYNKLTQKGSGYQEKITEKWLEVIDNNNIPVLQVELNKQKNSIDISGVAFDENGQTCSIFSPEYGFSFFPLPKPYLLMSQEDRDKFWYDLRIKLRKELKEPK
jgi:hypothetical protein